MARTRILLTGADTLLGSHILKLLLSDSELSIRAVVGTNEAAYAIQQQYIHKATTILDFVVIPGRDLGRPGAFDNVLDDHLDHFHTVIHTLTTTILDEADCLARFINLGSETVVNMLKSIQRRARRVVLISSLTHFARWLARDSQIERSTAKTIAGPTAFDAEYVLAASQAGDNIVHEAVSVWAKSSGARFDIFYITTPSYYGPATCPLGSSTDLSDANRRIWNICSNVHEDESEASPYGIAHFLDVRVGPPYCHYERNNDLTSHLGPCLRLCLCRLLNQRWEQTIFPIGWHYAY